MVLQDSDILFEDNHLIIVNKPCGVLVQGDKTGDTPLLEVIKKYIKDKYDKKGNVFLGLVNRIDRPTSGIVIYSKYVQLTFKKIQTLEKYCKVEVNLITGRHHQIRCNFSEIGYPILGDLKYGSKRSNKDGGIYLHSREIDFIHPVSKKKINIKADPPMKGLWSISTSY